MEEQAAPLDVSVVGENLEQGMEAHRGQDLACVDHLEGGQDMSHDEAIARLRQV